MSAAGLSGTADAVRHLALVGNPNCGKTALFNRLTGSRQKVANYTGVTVERKEGRFVAPSGRHFRLLDLPGTYSLQAKSPDEEVTRAVSASANWPASRGPTCWWRWSRRPTCACTCASRWSCARWAGRWCWCST